MISSPNLLGKRLNLAAPGAAVEQFLRAQHAWIGSGGHLNVLLGCADADAGSTLALASTTYEPIEAIPTRSSMIVPALRATGACRWVHVDERALLNDREAWNHFVAKAPRTDITASNLFVAAAIAEQARPDLREPAGKVACENHQPQRTGRLRHA